MVMEFQHTSKQTHIYIYTYNMYIYIYTSEWLYPFAGGRSATPVSRNEFLLFFKTPRNFFSHFSLTSSSCQDQMVFWCHTNLAAATVISVQLQSIQHCDYARLSVQCCRSENLNSFVFGRVVSFAKMCSCARNVIIPTPPHPSSP